MKKKALLLTALLAVIGVGSYFLLQDNHSEPTYLTENVIRTDVEKTVIASGTIDSINKVDVGAQVSGTITKLYVQMGQEVKKGDKIADIDSTTQLNMLNTKKAVLASYQAQLKAKQTAFNVAQSNYNRQSTLYRQQSTSLDSLNSAKSNLEATKAEMDALRESIKQAEIEVNTAETNLGYTHITSPIDGTVIATPISEGQTVNSNQSAPTIVTVANLDKMRIKPEISEGDITKVKAGQAVEFTILSDNKQKYQAIIESVDPATTSISDAKSTTTTSSTSAVYYYANMLVENPNRTLRIGMTTENAIKIASAKNVLAVSNMALRQDKGQDKSQDKGKHFVNVLNEQNQVERRDIEIGVQNEFHTEIKSGLSENEKVILSQISDGEMPKTQFRGPRLF